MTPQQSKVDKLVQADSQQQANPNANQLANGVTQQCPLQQPKKKFTHFGVRVAVHQYNIAGRTLGLELPVDANAASKDAEQFHKMAGSGFSKPEKSKEQPSPKAMYYQGEDSKAPSGFQADLTTSAPLMEETDVEGFQPQGGVDGAFNDFLGKEIAIHILRDKTYKNTKTDNFYVKDVVSNTPEVVATEKMGVKVFVYLRAKVNGKDGIYEVVDGKVGKAVSEQDYVKRKLIKDNQYSDSECGAMPLIPGVNQVHVLIDSSFKISEAYCDGDRIYPE